MGVNIQLSLVFLIFGPKFIDLKLLPAHRDYKNLIVDFKSQCLQVIKQRKETLIKDKNQANKKYLLDTLLLLQLEQNPQYPFPDDEILDNYLLFFRAGQETTSSLLNMICYNLAKYPEYCEKVRQEIKENIPSIEDMNYDNIGKLVYLTAFIKETQRLYNPTMVAQPRLLTTDCMLGKIQFQKGTIVAPLTVGGNFSSKYYTNPEEFNPRRWLADGEGTNLNESFSFIPFWAGVRSCIGQHLAMGEMKVILSQIVMRYNLKLKPDYKLKMRVTVFTVPLNPILFDIEKI